jgi:hypothetical protein
MDIILFYCICISCLILPVLVNLSSFNQRSYPFVLMYENVVIRQLLNVKLLCTIENVEVHWITFHHIVSHPVRSEELPSTKVTSNSYRGKF